MSKTLSLHRFTTETKRIVAAGQQLADELGHEQVTTLHVLVRLIELVPEAIDAFAHAGADGAKVKRDALAALAELPQRSADKAVLSREILMLLRRAEREAGEEDAAVDLPDLLNALTCETDGPTRTVLTTHDIAPGAFRSFWPADDGDDVDELRDDQHGAALLRDFAAEVRGDHDGVDHSRERQRGLELLERLQRQLEGPDAIPDVVVTREDAAKLRLCREGREGEIILSWDMAAGALAMHVESKGVDSLAHYLWNRQQKHWGNAKGDGGRFYEDLYASIRERFFPELQRK